MAPLRYTQLSSDAEPSVEDPVTGKAMTIYLPLRRSWMWALAACAVAAISEGLLAGSEVGVRFSELVLPPFSPPLWVWASIGVLYYLLFFFLLKLSSWHWPNTEPDLTCPRPCGDTPGRKCRVELAFLPRGSSLARHHLLCALRCGGIHTSFCPFPAPIHWLTPRTRAGCRWPCCAANFCRQGFGRGYFPDGNWSRAPATNPLAPPAARPLG